MVQQLFSDIQNLKDEVRRLRGKVDATHVGYQINASAITGSPISLVAVDGNIIIANATPKWITLAISIPAANVRNVLGIDNGELRPSWKTALDATAPTTIAISAVAAAGTSLIFAHRDHTHGAPDIWAVTINDEGVGQGNASILDFVGAGVAATVAAGTATITITGGVGPHAILSATHTDTLVDTVVEGDLIFGNTTPAWARLAVATQQPTAQAFRGRVLTVVESGTTVLWQEPSCTTFWRNDSGGARAVGDVVVDTGDDVIGKYNTTTTQGDPNVIGVLYGSFQDTWDAVPDQEITRIAHTGYVYGILMNTSVIAGNYVRSSTVAGRAEDAGTIPTTGVFGRVTFPAAAPGDIASGYLFPTIPASIYYSGHLSVGSLTAPANVTSGDVTAIRVFLTANSQYNGLRGSATRAGNIIYELPTTDPTSGQVLTSLAPVAGVSVMSWGAAAVAAHNIFSATHGDTTGAASPVDGDIIIGNVTPLWSKLAISIPAANVRNVLGIDNGELRPSWKTALDGTSATTSTVSTVAAPGTSLIFSHRDHAHDITSSSAPGAAASILASTAAGALTLVNLNVSGWERVGSAAAPANTTAGDLTTIRLEIGNTAIPAGGWLVHIPTDTAGLLFKRTADVLGGSWIQGQSSSGGVNFTLWNDGSVSLSTATATAFSNGQVLFTDQNVTDITATTKVLVGITPSFSVGANNVTAEYRVLNFLGTTIGADSGNLSNATGVQAIRIDFRHRSSGLITRFVGHEIFAGPDGLTAAANGRFTTIDSFEVGFVARNASTATVTTWRGLLITNASLGAGPAVLTTQIGIDIAALSGAGTNFGIRNASNSVQTGYARFGAITAPTNVTNGDVTCIRLKVGDGAFGSGVEFSVTGDGALSGFLRVGSETAPTNASAGDVTMAGRLTITPSASQAIAAGDAVTVTSSFAMLTSAGNVTLTSAPTVADGQDGQELTILNVDATDSITFQDQGTLANSNLRLAAGNVVLGPRSSIKLIYSATVGDWVQLGGVTVL